MKHDKMLLLYTTLIPEKRSIYILNERKEGFNYGKYRCPEKSK